MKKALIIGFVMIFFVAGVLAVDLSQTERDERVGVIIEPPENPSNTSFNNVNSSEYWDNLDSPDDITGSEFWYNQTSKGYVPYSDAVRDVDLGSEGINRTAGVNSTTYVQTNGFLFTGSGMYAFGDDVNFIGQDTISFDLDELLYPSITTAVNFRNGYSVTDDAIAIFGTNGEGQMVVETSGNDHFQFGAGGFGILSNFFSIVDTDDLGIANRDVPTTNDPVLRIWSADGNNANDWFDLLHDRTNAVIRWGDGVLSLNNTANITSSGNADFINITAQEYEIKNDLNMSDNSLVEVNELNMSAIGDKICWDDRCIWTASAGAFIYDVSNGVNSPRYSLSNDIATAQILFFNAGQSDHVSVIPASAYDYFYFENAGAGENKVIRQYGRVGGTAEWVSTQVNPDGWYNVSRGSSNVLGMLVNMPLNVTDHLDAEGNATINNFYAEGWGSNIGDVAIGSAGVYYNVTNMTVGELNGFTFDGENFTVLKSGLYRLNSFWSFSGTANNEYHISMSVNSEQQDKCHAERVIGTGGDVGTAGFTCLYRFSFNDLIKLVIENEDSAGDPTIHDINVNFLRIAE